MQSMFRHLGIRRLIAEEAPSFAVSLAIAEILYKFQSFTLEALAFVGTWYVLGTLQRAVGGSRQGAE